MDQQHNIKELLLDELRLQLDKKAETLKNIISSAKESRDNETKSSAGDKYETGRAMVQMEIDKNTAQLAGINKQINELTKIDTLKEFQQAEFGSIIETNRGNYFLSIGLGKVVLSGKDWFCISISSPIGKVLHQKKEGDSFQFQGREFQVIRIG